MIKEIFFCIIGSSFFAIIMKVPKNCLIYVFIGTALTTIISIILSNYYSELISCMLAMICLMFFCEMIARLIKTATTIILMPATIPLLPGSYIYYAMLYGIKHDDNLLKHYSILTIQVGLGIALGAIISSIIVKLFNYIKKN